MKPIQIYEPRIFCQINLHIALQQQQQYRWNKKEGISVLCVTMDRLSLILRPRFFYFILFILFFVFFSLSFYGFSVCVTLEALL